MKKLSDIWSDVKCAECRKRLEAADSPHLLFRVRSYSHTRDGHAVYDTGAGVTSLCQAEPWPGKRETKGR